jgi:teichuronic acid biosynthesis glycosyltransferase TuaG
MELSDELISLSTKISQVRIASLDGVKILTHENYTGQVDLKIALNAPTKSTPAIITKATVGSLFLRTENYYTIVSQYGRKMLNSLVSILIPTYNSMNFLENTFQSCFNQDYENFEIVVSDDCSEDETYKYLLDLSKKNERLRVMSNDRNLGSVRNFNKLIDEAKGEFLKFLGSDDEIFPNFISYSVNELSKIDYKKNFFVSPELSPTTKRLEIIREKHLNGMLDSGELFRELVKKGNWIGGPSSILIHKELIGKSRFNTLYPSVYDYDFYLMLGLKYGAIIGEKPLYRVGIHDKQDSRIFEKGQFSQETIRILLSQKNRNKVNHFTIFRVILKNLVEYFYIRIIKSNF